MYDVTSRASFDALNGWLKEMRIHLDKSSDIDLIAFVVCANKVTQYGVSVIGTSSFPSTDRLRRPSS